MGEYVRYIGYVIQTYSISPPARLFLRWSERKERGRRRRKGEEEESLVLIHLFSVHSTAQGSRGRDRIEERR